MTGMAQPVFVHVGLMKSGTTYLQHTLRANGEEVLRQGVGIVPQKRSVSFRMALDLRGLAGPGTGRRKGGGSFRRLPRKLARAEGERLLFTEEVLSGCSPEQVAVFGETLGDREVHVVFTIRDIARSIPSMWQQSVKGGRSHTYDDYVGSVIRRKGKGATHFWTSQDAVALLERWTAIAPPERIHVVVVPHAGAPRDLLLERFCSVLGLDASLLTNAPKRTNDSLGRAQVELLRRINEGLSEDARRSDLHGEVVKRPFALGILAQQPGEKILLSKQYADWCHEHATTAIAAIRAAGYRVVGDLDELLPDESVYATDLPPVAEAAVAESAVDGLVALMEERVASRVAEIEERAAARAERRRAARSGQGGGRKA